MTYKQVCQVIAHYQEDLYRVLEIEFNKVTWEQVYNYSPSGELFMIYYWYQEAINMYREFGNNLEKLKPSN